MITYEITMADGSVTEVTGERAGDFLAIREDDHAPKELKELMDALGTGIWRIDHLPSGKCICQGICNRPRADLVSDQLMEHLGESLALKDNVQIKMRAPKDFGNYLTHMRMDPELNVSYKEFMDGRAK